MTTAQYDATLASLNASMESEVSTQIDGNKPAVVGLFPSLFRVIVATILWPCLLRIGRVIGAKLVGVVLKKLGQMTLAEVAGLLEMYLRTQGMPVNPDIKLFSYDDLDGNPRATVNAGIGSVSASDHIDLFAPDTAPASRDVVRSALKARLIDANGARELTYDSFTDTWVGLGVTLTIETPKV